MNRRHLMAIALGYAWTTSLTGYNVSTKKHIRSFAKIFTCLKDPEFRKKEIGDSLLIVEGAEFSGERFDGMEWRNVVFKNCDFIGAYDIGPKTAIDLRYEDCNFTGILSFGVTSNVRFFRCQWKGAPVMFAEKGSTNTWFEACTFEGASSDPNQQGTVGSEGEAHFVKCKAKWINWTGDSVLSIQDCECEDISIHTDSSANSGVGYLSSAFVIERSKLRGTFGMAACHLESLTVRDTVMDNLDLTNATIKGDVVIERVKGGAMQIGIKEGAGSFTLKDSQVYGNGDAICYIYAGAFKSVLVERSIFGGDVTKPTVIGGGFDPDIKSAQPTATQSFVLRGNKVPFLRSGYLNAGHVVIEGNSIDSLDLQQSRVDELEIANNTITRSVNFTGTQAKKSKVQTLVNGQADLAGSNIKMN